MASNLLTLDGYIAISKELKKYIDENINMSTADLIVQKDSYLKFPVVGKENAIYIDTTQKAIYRWDNTEIKYYKVSETMDGLEVIDGAAGFKSERES